MLLTSAVIRLHVLRRDVLRRGEAHLLQTRTGRHISLQSRAGSGPRAHGVIRLHWHYRVMFRRTSFLILLGYDRNMSSRSHISFLPFHRRHRGCAY